MSSHDLRCRMAVAVAAIIAWAMPSALNAADLGPSLFMDQPPPVQTQPVEFGTGWYIRGSAAWARQTQPSLFPTYASVPSAQSNDWALEVGGGYQFNRWFRSDATYTYYGKQQASGNGAFVNCPSSITGLYTTQNGTQTPIGVVADGNQCTPRQSAAIQKNLFLANGYVDLGTWAGVTPYVGAGAGAAYVVTNQTVNYVNNSDGSAYRATLTLPAGYPAVFYSIPNSNGQQFILNPQPHYNYGAQNWDYSTAKGQLGFAFALMAGVSYNLTSNAKLDIGYRYVNFGSLSGISSLSGELFNKLTTTQEVHVGLRYLID
ncbi:MAG: outer membrane protein [Methylovirgula sp.]